MSATDRGTGVALAATTAVVSGFAVFVNAYGVRSWSVAADATTYTTVKNAMAAIILVGVGLLLRRRGAPDAQRATISLRQRLLLGLIAVVGGSVPFLLFFEGLSLASSTQAAFIHKTLIVWVAMLAPLLLGERLRLPHVGAIGLLVAGQFLLIGGVDAIVWGRGETMMLAATLLWSAEVIIAKKVLSDVPSLTVGIARMAGGALLLIAWTVIRGSADVVLAAGLAQWGWVLLTGATLAAFVGTWYAALSRAPAIDVSAVLVGGALVTAVLRSGLAAIPLPDPMGLMVVAAGVALALHAARRWQPT